MHVGYWWESQKDHYEDQDIGGWIILKCMFEREREDGVVWTGFDLAQDRYQWRASCECGNEPSGSIKF
jgi:hypothetical protein